ncbi:MAG: hypothetical protein OXG16_13900 [Rhodospirillales bacterium]|nr:hypothetical protein [Rhodospirillales bacterium]
MHANLPVRRVQAARALAEHAPHRYLCTLCRRSIIVCAAHAIDHVGR